MHINYLDKLMNSDLAPHIQSLEIYCSEHKDISRKNIVIFQLCEMYVSKHFSPK